MYYTVHAALPSKELGPNLASHKMKQVHTYKLLSKCMYVACKHSRYLAYSTKKTLSQQQYSHIHQQHDNVPILHAHSQIYTYSTCAHTNSHTPKGIVPTQIPPKCVIPRAESISPWLYLNIIVLGRTLFMIINIRHDPSCQLLTQPPAYKSDRMAFSSKQDKLFQVQCVGQLW